MRHPSNACVPLVLFLSALALSSVAAGHELRNLTAAYRPESAHLFAKWSADGERVLFEVGNPPLEPVWLAVAERDPGSVHELAGPFFPPGNLHFELSLDGRRALYRTVPADDDAPRELWSVPVDGSAPAIRLHGALGSGETIRFFLLSPDAERVAFVVHRGEGEEELHVGHVDGTPAAVVVDAGVAFDDDEIVFSPDGSELVYWVDTDADDSVELRATAIATGSSRSVSGVDQAADSSRGQLAVTADATRAIFSYEVADSGRMFLSSAELFPGGEDIDLTGGVAPGSSVERFVLAEGGRVVFLGDLGVAGRDELWSVPVDGSSERARVNGDLPDGGDVGLFRVAGGWVVYLADEAVDDKHELWSAPVNGFFEPTRRSGTLAANRDVVSFQVAANGTALVYAADGEALDRVDLYRTSVSGITAIERLSNRNPFQTSFYSVEEFDIAPDSRTLAWVSSNGSSIAKSIFEQDLVAPTDFASLLGSTALAANLAYLDDRFGVAFRGNEEGSGRADVLTLDLRLFADGFEGGDAERWDS